MINSIKTEVTREQLIAKANVFGMFSGSNDDEYSKMFKMYCDKVKEYDKNSVE
jgi:hypothetical protein